MSSKDVPEQPLLTEKTNDDDPEQQQQQIDSSALEKKGKKELFTAAKVWMVLSAHGACCLALAFSMASGLDGYEAVDKTSPHHVDGKLLLRVSDITTLISAALVVIKIVVGTWSTIILWAFGQHMCSDDIATWPKVLKMIRWKLPPALLDLKIPRDFPSWTISIAIIAVFIQGYINPILTGSVNWNSGFHISNKATLVSSVDPTAKFGDWYWYNAQGSFDKRAYLRQAVGYANLAWADPSTLDSQGKSFTGNGCRHVGNNDGLSRNSTIVHAILPCINVNSIHWYRSKDEVTGNEWPIDGRDLTLVNDNPFTYYVGGVTIVYDTNNLRKNANISIQQPPPVNKFSGKMTVALMTARRHYDTDLPCAQLPNTKFGNISTLPYLAETAFSSSADENCFLLGKIDFSAGVTNSSKATYLGPRIIEDVTPIEDVVYESNPWVEEAIWLLPDLVTMLAVSNASQLPTFDNIENYVSGIVRQGYLGAWDMLSHSFVDDGPSYNAFPADPRLIAQVSLWRVFTWLAISLCMTASGAVALGFVLKGADLKPPKDDKKSEEDSGGELCDLLQEYFDC